MKPILFLDANVFAKFDYSILEKYIDDNKIVITDDVVKEMLAAKNKIKDNSDFDAKVNLFFNEFGGLNDNMCLSLSHFPIGIENVYNNTRNIDKGIFI